MASRSRVVTISEGSSWRPGAITRTTGTPKNWRVRSRQKVSIPSFSKRSYDQSKDFAPFSCANRKMRGVLGNRLQQHALIGIDHRAPQVGAILRIECAIPALAALGGDDRIGQFELAHLRNRGAHRRLQPRPRREAEGKTGTIGPAGDGRDRGHADIRRNIEQPGPAPRRCGVPELPQQIFSRDAGFMLRRNRSAELTAPPPQRGRVALDQFQADRAGLRPPATDQRPIRYSAETAA